jgi:carbon monoxide dehydrogenase subunit G
MLIEGKFVLNVPIQKLWDFLLEPGTLASCIPGAEKVEAIDDKTYECVVKQSVGPISVRFKFTVVLTEVEPPKHIKAVGRGEALGKMGTFTCDVNVRLAEISKDEVEVFYQTNVNIVGRLATFGERIMRAKAKSVGEKFTRNLQEKMKSGTVPTNYSNDSE